MGVLSAVADYGCLDVVATFMGPPGGGDIVFPVRGTAAKTHSESGCGERMAVLLDQLPNTSLDFKAVPSCN